MKQSFAIRSRRVPFSSRLDRRVPGVFGALVIVTLALMIISVGVGEFPIGPLDVLRTIVGLPTANSDYDFIVNTLRLPRVLVAACVGAALAIAGTITQGIARNPLASPDILGVSAGAGLAAVSLIVGFDQVSTAWLPFAAFGGALVAALAVYLLAWTGGSTPLRLILIGIGITAIAQALTTVMITFGEINQVSQAMIWLTGSVYGRTWEHLRALLPWLLVGVPIALVGARHLNALQLGDDVARGIGTAIERQRGVLLLASVALAGATVATAGTIGFVGLIAPHIARRLVGGSHEGLLPTAAITGSLIVVLSDLVGRTIVAPIEVPAGVVTAAIGAPYFLYLLYRR